MKKVNWKNITIELLAGIISTKLKEFEIDSVLVGGACVSIYSKNRYESYDLDYVTHEDMASVEKALSELGFEKKGRHFSRKDCFYSIEFVAPPVAIGEELIKNFKNWKTPLGKIKMLTPTDCVKDRLASFFYWNDRQGLEQAILVCLDQKVDFDDLKKWSKKEGHLEKFTIFKTKFSKHKKNK